MNNLMDDETLMEAVAHGDVVAFAQLFDRYAPALFRFAARLVRNDGRAEELTQEVFMRLYARAKHYRRNGSLRTLLYRMTTNACLNEKRRWKHAPPLDSSPSTVDPRMQPTSLPSPADHLDAKRLEAEVQRTLDTLSPRERAAFVMCRIDGVSYRETATALETTESAIKSLVHRATVSLFRAVYPESSENTRTAEAPHASNR